MHNTLPETFSTTTQDRFIAAMDGDFTMIIQLEMAFEYCLDEQRLARAAALTMDAVPILCCRFVPRMIRPYWQRLEKTDHDIFTMVKEEEDYQAFKKKGIDFISHPQMRLCLYRSGQRDSVTLKVSHAVSDTTGVKDIAALLSDIYNRLARDPDYCPDPDQCNLRSYRRIAMKVPWHAFPGIALNYIIEVTESLIPGKTRSVPVRGGPREKKQYITRHIEKEALTQMAGYAKKQNATINDILLAAIFRALSKPGQGDGKTALRIAIAIDLRRYAHEMKKRLVANFSSMEVITYGTAMEGSFESTLERVVQKMNERKSAWLGLNTVLSVYAGIWALPFSLLDIFLKAGMKFQACSPNSADWFTNMGEIPMGSVCFGGYPVHARLLPPVSHLPVFLYACSAYDGSLTFAAGITPDKEGMNETAVNEFFDLVISELTLMVDTVEGPFL